MRFLSQMIDLDRNSYWVVESSFPRTTMQRVETYVGQQSYMFCSVLCILLGVLLKELFILPVSVFIINLCSSLLFVLGVLCFQTSYSLGRWKEVAVCQI